MNDLDRNRTKCFAYYSKYKDVELKRTYGITRQDYRDIFDSQDGCCAICRTPQVALDVSLNVDHCHKTGKIRGLLCRGCNTGIGGLKDSLQIVVDAAAYLWGASA